MVNMFDTVIIVRVGSANSTWKIPYVEILRSAMPNFSRTHFWKWALILTKRTTWACVSSGTNGGVRSSSQNFKVRYLHANWYRQLNNWSQSKHPQGTQRIWKKGNFLRFTPSCVWFHYSYGHSTLLCISLSGDMFMLWHSANMLWFARGGSWEAQLLLEEGPCFRCVFTPLLHTAPSKRGNISHCSVRAWAFSAATACSGVCFRTTKHIREEELSGHLGHPLPTQEVSLARCPGSIGSSDQALWASEGGQTKDTWFGKFDEFFPIAVNTACFKLSGKCFCHCD